MAFEKIDLSDGSNQACSPAEYEPGLHQYISNPRVLDLPESGEITFRYTRGPVTVRQAYKDQPASASADFVLHEITNVVAAKGEGQALHTATESRLDELFQEALKNPEPAEEE